VPPTPDRQRRIQKTLRMLCDSVFKLKPNDDAIEKVNFDKINLSETQWRRVSLLLRRFRFLPQALNPELEHPADNMYGVDFEEAEETGVDPEHRHTPHKVQVILFHWLMRDI
jgi:hypothetical protein